MFLFLFRIADGSVDPILPRREPPDGITIFTLEQTAEKTGLAIEALRDRWVRECVGVMPVTDFDGKPATDPDVAEPGADELKLWEEMTAAERDDLTRETLYPQLDGRQFQMFKGICIDRGFSVYSRKLHPEIRNGKLQIITTVMALRHVADRDGRNGCVEPVWSGDDEVWKEVWNGPLPPLWAKVGVKKRGFKSPVFGKAAWESYKPVDGSSGIDIIDPFWVQHAPGQLAKCAEALALRTAFPRLDGLYCKEEMERVRLAEKAKARQQQGGPRLVEEQPAPVDDAGEPEPIEEDEYNVLMERAGFTGAKRTTFEAMMAGKHSKLARYNRPMLYRVVAQELRKIIKQRESA